MSGEQRDSIAAQLGYLTHAVESAAESIRELNAALRKHMDEEDAEREDLLARIADVELLLARQKGWIAGAVSIVLVLETALSYVLK